MKKIFLLLGQVYLLFLLTHPIHAAEYGTREEAQALVNRAIEHLKAVGPEKAFADITDRNGKFVDRDLYVFVADQKGIRVAHGLNEKLVGKSLEELKDVNGKAFGSEILALGRAGKTGWVDYIYTDPTTKKLFPKSSYIDSHGGYTFGVGVYIR
jgi:signal transduction histidine kinase